jgi:hypothetical protein
VKILAVTGTSKVHYITDVQKRWAKLILETLSGYGYDQLVSGEAAGWDEVINDIAREAGWKTYGYPSSAHAHRIEVDGRADPKRPLERDWDMAEICDAMMAGPAGPESSWPRAGEWATVRYARSLFKPVFIVYPDGKTEYEENREGT